MYISNSSGPKKKVRPMQQKLMRESRVQVGSRSWVNCCRCPRGHDDPTLSRGSCPKNYPDPAPKSYPRKDATVTKEGVVQESKPFAIASVDIPVWEGEGVLLDVKPESGEDDAPMIVEKPNATAATDDDWGWW
ncbi:hypothetical protein EDB86DRAFT_2839201 [Lactarius hatsudake]|nr:hypothetical protein EDB86DRAFT_2839201 [Lactarius hatsudake]